MLYEPISINNVNTYIQKRCKGVCILYYDAKYDTLHVQIDNHRNTYTTTIKLFAEQLWKGVSSKDIASQIVAEYKRYIIDKAINENFIKY